MIGMIGFTLSYGEMFFHSNFLASGGSSVQNIMSKTISIQKNAQVKLISCPKCLKLPAGLVKSSMETGKVLKKNVYLLKYCYHRLHEFCGRSLFCESQ